MKTALFALPRSIGSVENEWRSLLQRLRAAGRIDDILSIWVYESYELRSRPCPDDNIVIRYSTSGHRMCIDQRVFCTQL